jgi:hypothetical protein
LHHAIGSSHTNNWLTSGLTELRATSIAVTQPPKQTLWRQGFGDRPETERFVNRDLLDIGISNASQIAFEQSQKELANENA